MLRRFAPYRRAGGLPLSIMIVVVVVRSHFGSSLAQIPSGLRRERSQCLRRGAAIGPAAMDLDARTVGVVARDSRRMQPGYTLICVSREVYLLDEDGLIVHSWSARRNVFCAHLLPGGHLLRDGSENVDAPCFSAGGAAGYVEVVDWDGVLVWSFTALPFDSFLTHHELEPLPNGNVLVLCWERKSRDEALAAGRRPELLPDGEVWGDMVLELQPPAERGGVALVVWTWKVWDHLVQDYDEAKANYGKVASQPGKIDINYCPAGGKAACRNRDLLLPEAKRPHNASGLTAFVTAFGSKTGEKDWLHCNAVAYDAERDQVLLSVNMFSEVVFIDHATTTAEAAGSSGGRRGRGGDLLYRFGNPRVHRNGGPQDQTLYQHGAHMLRGVPGEG